ncbi:MAG: isochorismatase family protein [Syntrophomonadaceae bacterium]|nr:isochorismatase family protein [Syntrophomonadaceae bacterium]
MKKFRLNSDDSILLVIDLQEKLMKAMDQSEKVYRYTSLLLETAKQLQIPVIVSEQYPRGLGSTVEQIYKHLPEHQLIQKTTFSCGEPLLSKIADFNRNTVIVTGSETHVCVFQTVIDLLDKGYTVHVVRNAVCSRFKEDYQNGLELMKEAGAIITNAETVVFDLLKQAGTPDFKAISPLIK